MGVGPAGCAGGEGLDTKATKRHEEEARRRFGSHGAFLTASCAWRSSWLSCRPPSERMGFCSVLWGCRRSRGWGALFNSGRRGGRLRWCPAGPSRSEEHTSELQSLMRISYAVFCLKKKTRQLQTSKRKTK